MSARTFGFLEQLPEHSRDSFMWLAQDLVSLQQKWDFYLELFGKTQNTDLLSELAPVSFNIVYEALRNDITMAICRLSEASKSKSQENLTMETLLRDFSDIEGLDTLIAHFQNICAPVRRRRNKRVGHRDFNTVIKPLENPLPGIAVEQIEVILKSAAFILNYVRQKYDNGEFDFHLRSTGGADTLIFWLKKAKASKSSVTGKLLYFEASSMKELYSCIARWQDQNEMYIHSLNIQRDGDKFGCIASIDPERSEQKTVETKDALLEKITKTAYEEAMARFERKALRIIVGEKRIGALVEYVDASIPSAKILAIQSKLKECTTAAEIKMVFMDEL